MDEKRIFVREGDVKLTLRKAEAYFSAIARSTNDLMVVPNGDRLVKKILDFSTSLDNGYEISEKSNIVTECLKIDSFRTTIFKNI